VQQGVAPELPLKPFVFCLADAGQPGELYRYVANELATCFETFVVTGCPMIVRSTGNRRQIYFPRRATSDRLQLV